MLVLTDFCFGHYSCLHAGTGQFPEIVVGQEVVQEADHTAPPFANVQPFIKQVVNLVVIKDSTAVYLVLERCLPAEELPRN
jgi:hypothetical protein